MIVITLSDCPGNIRGDLSKWLCEINTGVYVGQLNARVREELWGRICKNLKTGRATMVFSAPGEQKMDFRVHNTTWKPVDLDGIKLMKRPVPNKKTECAPPSKTGFSRASKLRKVERVQAARQRQSQQPLTKPYFVLDIETSGLSFTEDEILEIGVLRISEDQVAETYWTFVQYEKEIPLEIQELCGFSPEKIDQEGKPLVKALEELFEFIGSGKDTEIVCHNASFDLGFIKSACKKCELSLPTFRCVDSLSLARRKIRGIRDYKLDTICQHLGIVGDKSHRALNDCVLTYKLYEKLKQM